MNINNTNSHKASEKMKKAALYLLLFLCFFIPFRTPLSDLTFSAVKAVPDVLILALFVWYVISVRFKLTFKTHDFFFLGFLALGLFSTLINGLGLGLFIYQTRSIGIYYIMYYVVRNLSFGKAELCAFTRGLQIASVPLFALALVERLFSKTVLFSSSFAATLDQINYSRLYSMFYNPNTYGLFLVFVILLSLWMGFYTGKKTHIGVYCSLFCALYMTMSRSSMMILALALGALLFAYFKFKKESISFKKLGIAVLCIVLSTAALSAAVTYFSNWYFEYKAQYVIMDRIFPHLKQEITEVTYLTPAGKTKTGYVYNGSTYTDRLCTKPLKEYGSIVSVDDKEYILTNEGGKLVGDFVNLPASEQNRLLDGAVDRVIALRDNSYLENIKSSLGVSSGDRFSELSKDVLYSANTNMRLYSLKCAFELACERPLWGKGFGSYGSSASLTREEVPHYEKFGLPNGFYADNQYACVMAETGFSGLVLFMAFLFTCLWSCRKNLLKLTACVIIGWFGIFYNILEVQIGALMLWTVLSFELDDVDIFKKADKNAFITK